MAAELAGFKVMDMPAFKMVGREIRTNMGGPEGNPIPAFWGRCFAEGVVARLEALPGRIHTNALIGWAGRYDPTDGAFSYIVGVLAEPDASVPDDMVGVDVPASAFAVCTIRGPEPDIYMAEHNLMQAQIKAHGLAPNHALGCAIEWYDERFEGTVHVIDYYEPIVRRPERG